MFLQFLTILRRGNYAYIFLNLIYDSIPVDTIDSISYNFNVILNRLHNFSLGYIAI